jgi:proteasome lid subunit RPN8/RPN11
MMVSVRIQRIVVDSILTYAKVFHPKEGILLLRGRNEKNTIIIDEVVIPPFAVYGTGFSSFPVHMLPADFVIVGTAHSHPSGTLIPSIGDLNNFYGKVMIITGHPYRSEQQIAIFNKEGKIVKYKIIDN